MTRYNIQVHLDVVDVDDLPLKGLKTLDKHKLMIDNVHNRFAKIIQIKVLDKKYYLEYFCIILFLISSLFLYNLFNSHPNITHFSTGEQNLLHRHFFHPSKTKLLNLRRITSTSNANTNTIKLLKYTNNRYYASQIEHSIPLRFKVSFRQTLQDSTRGYLWPFSSLDKEIQKPYPPYNRKGTHVSYAVRLKIMKKKT